jgi:hypothetical protein
LEDRLTCLADAGPQAITDRLNDLEREWSAGRVTKAALGVVIIAGLIPAVLLSRWWLILPGLGGLLLVQYLFTRSSLVGAFFRAVGFRSGADIDQEKFALKVLRGDFRQLPTCQEIENREDISRLEGEGGIAIDPDFAKPDAVEVVREVIVAARV